MMPIIGVKCDKFVTKSQAPTTPTGYPPISLFRERDNPPKKSMQQCFTRIGDFTWRVSDCEELVGGTHLVKSDAFPIYHSP